MFGKNSSKGKEEKRKNKGNPPTPTAQLHHEPDFTLKPEQSAYNCNQVFHILTLAQDELPNIKSQIFREANETTTVEAFDRSVLPLLTGPEFNKEEVTKAIALIAQKYTPEQMRDAWARLIKKTFQQGNVFNVDARSVSPQFSALWKIFLMQLQTRLIKDIDYYKRKHEEKWWEELRKNDNYNTINLIGIRSLFVNFLGELRRIDPRSAKTIYLFLATTKTITEQDSKYDSGMLYANCALIAPCLLSGLCLSGRLFSESMKEIHFAHEITSPALESQFMRRIAYAVTSMVSLGRKHELEDIVRAFSTNGIDTLAQAAPKGFTPAHDAAKQVITKIASDPELESMLQNMSVSDYNDNGAKSSSPPLVQRRGSNSH